jgi:hypothetical protein
LGATDINFSIATNTRFLADTVPLFEEEAVSKKFEDERPSTATDAN